MQAGDILRNICGARISYGRTKAVYDTIVVHAYLMYEPNFKDLPKLRDRDR